MRRTRACHACGYPVQTGAGVETCCTECGRPLSAPPPTPLFVRMLRVIGIAAVIVCVVLVWPIYVDEWEVSTTTWSARTRRVWLAIVPGEWHVHASPLVADATCLTDAAAGWRPSHTVSFDCLGMRGDRGICYPRFPQLIWSRWPAFGHLGPEERTRATAWLRTATIDEAAKLYDDIGWGGDCPDPAPWAANSPAPQAPP